MNRRHFIGGAVFIGASQAGTAQAGSKALLANGDSITFGVRPGVTLADTFIQKIGVHRGFDCIVNTAVPGHSSTEMVTHWAADLAAHKPSSVFIGMSANNISKGVSIDQAERDMRDMISMAQNAGAKVTIASHNLYRDAPYLHSYQMPLLDMLANVSTTIRDVVYIDVFREWMRELFYMGYTPGVPCPPLDALYAPDSEGLPDGLHPSALGHHKIFELLKKSPGACAV